MRTINKIIYALTIVFLLSACENENDITSINSEILIGNWINPQINDTTWSFDKAENLEDNNYGFAFKAGRNFIERKHFGWCATPPIAYSDFAGTWNRNDSMLNITVEYWGGTVDYEWKIIWVDKHSLGIYKIKEVYHNRE